MKLLEFNVDNVALRDTSLSKNPVGKRQQCGQAKRGEDLSSMCADPVRSKAQW